MGVTSRILGLVVLLVSTAEVVVGSAHSPFSARQKKGVGECEPSSLFQHELTPFGASRLSIDRSKSVSEHEWLKD